MRLLWVALVVLALAGCSGQTETPEYQLRVDVARTANSEIAAGPMRMIFNLRDETGSQVGGAEIPAWVNYYRAPDATAPRTELITGTAMSWIAYPDGRGLYASVVDLPESGYYEAEITLRPRGAPEESVRTRFEALAAPSTPAIGADAPRSQTKTAATGDLASMTTDTDPDPALYQMPVADAVTSGRPSVIVFSTPARCTSNTCGPALDVIKEVKRQAPEVNFVHVEIFANPSDPRDDTLVPAVTEWKLPTEPWVFVVDAGGKIRAKFEGMVSPTELRDALAGLSGAG